MVLITSNNCQVQCSTAQNSTTSKNMKDLGEKVLYFAFGSNLLESRMFVNNPTAVRVGVGEVKDFQLEFASYSKIWKGYAATIIPSKGMSVWGALWEIPLQDIPRLDKQEGVHVNLYQPIFVDVVSADGKIQTARSYRQLQNIDKVSCFSQLPDERKPTPAYLKVMVDGAVESKLPQEYIEYLKQIPHNGSDVKPDLKYNIYFAP